MRSAFDPAIQEVLLQSVKLRIAQCELRQAVKLSEVFQVRGHRNIAFNERNLLKHPVLVTQCDWSKVQKNMPQSAESAVFGRRVRNARNRAG